MFSETQDLCPSCFSNRGGASVCGQCGYDELTVPIVTIALPPHTILNGQYHIGRVLGTPGGFGITYLALDVNLDTRVAVKEYLPRESAVRETDRYTVSPHSGEDRELFEYGLKRFLDEARILAQLDHPNLVRVRNFFQANGTAYMVMDYYEGMTLAEFLEQKGGQLPEQMALDILMPILDGLRTVHEKGFLHRDIKPQNIYLTSDGRPLLLDFGAARIAMGQRSRSLSVVLTPGYAPFEQYRSKGKHGPWTDIYSVGAVLYRMLTGELLPDAPDREHADELQPPSRLVGGLTSNTGTAIMRALEVKPEKRPQTVVQFQKMLLPPASMSTRIITDDADSPEPWEIAAALTWLLVMFSSGAALWIYHDSTVNGAVIGIAFTAIGLGGIYVIYRIGNKFGQGNFWSYCIPVYNLILLCRCAGIPGMTVAGFFVPIINIGCMVFLFGSIGKRLGKQFWASGLGSLIFFFTPLVMAFDGSQPMNERGETALPMPGPNPVVPEKVSHAGCAIRFVTGEYMGSVIDIPFDGLIIGRDGRQSNLVMSSSDISRSHLRIFPDINNQNMCIVEDLNSTNGTFVQRDDGGWDRLHEPRTLRRGTRLDIGDNVALIDII